MEIRSARSAAFSPTEREIVAARKQMKWEKIGVDGAGDQVVSVSNESR